MDKKIAKTIKLYLDGKQIDGSVKRHPYRVIRKLTCDMKNHGERSLTCWGYRNLKSVKTFVKAGQ